jgi:beta-galactosidase
VTVEAYADADEVAFIVNGVESARVTVGSELPYLATADVPYSHGRVEVIAYRRGVETGRHELHTAGPAVRVELQAESDTLLADSQDIAFVGIALVDARGVIQPTADAVVSIAVEGPAVLQGLGSARQSTEESFLSQSCVTYQGRALAVVRFSDGPGLVDAQATSVTVSATVHGLPPASVEINVTPPRTTPQPA